MPQTPQPKYNYTKFLKNNFRGLFHLRSFLPPYLVPSRASLVAQMVKRLPTMRETWVWSLGREDPLEKERATYPSIHAWKIPWTKESGGLQSMGSQRVGHDWAISLHFTSVPSNSLTLHPCLEMKYIPLWVLLGSSVLNFSCLV